MKGGVLWRVLIGIVLCGVPSGILAQDAECVEGQEVTEDTAGHCCWPGQVWHGARERCVGIPLMCPKGMVPSEDERCVEASGGSACDGGREATPDTRGNCCWPGQAWSTARERCVGVPMSCPEGTRLEGESCASVEMGTLTVKTMPEGAELWMDGALVGKTPVELEVAPGTVRLTVRQGRDEKEMEVEVAAGARRVVVMTFK